MIPSPCNNICKLDLNNVCIGCGRTIDEISTWGSASNEQKIAILTRINDQYYRKSSRES